MQSKNILISIVIPVKNGDMWLDNCIQGLMSQTLFEQSEIIIIDSGSEDQSLEILKKYPVNVYQVSSESFNHGLTRNEALKWCQGKYIVMTVQDARPVDNFWLQHLLNGFKIAKNVAGVCGQQVVPHELDKNPAEWFRPVSSAGMKVFNYSKEEYEKLSPKEKKDSCSWDNVTAMYNRKVLEQLPFEKVIYGEDAVWAYHALINGYSLVYNQAARVFHYHNQDFSYVFRRTITVMYLRYKTFGYIGNRPEMSLVDKLRLVKVILISVKVPLNKIIFWYQYNLELHRGVQSGYDSFVKALAEGENVLDQLHVKYCGQPPVPLKMLN